MQISTRSEDFVVDALALRSDVGAADRQLTIADHHFTWFPPACPYRAASC